MMKRHSVFVLVISLGCFIASCKKDHNTGSTPMYIPASQPGIITLSQTYFTLHPDTGGGSHNYLATLTARLYDSNGQLDSIQPTFAFTSDNTAIATIDNAGNMTALKPGSAAISVTDNVHGVSYANVYVLPYDSVLPANALNIVFTAPVMALPVGSTQTATYQLFDGLGNVVNTPVTLSAGNAPGITISGNSIQASASGVYTISAFNASQQQLSGALMLHAYVPQTGSGGWQWDASVAGKKIVTSIGMGAIPKRFLRPGLTAQPMVVNVYEEDYTIPPSPGHIAPGFNIYEASPDAINFGNDVLTLSNGRVKSNRAGETAIYATYKGVKSDILAVWVHPDFRGKYSLKVDNSNPGDYPASLDIGTYYNDDYQRSRDIEYYCDHCGGGAPDQYSGLSLDFTGCDPTTGNEDLGGSMFILEMMRITGGLTEGSGITFDGVILGNVTMAGKSFGLRQTTSSSYELSGAGTGTITRQDNVSCTATPNSGSFTFMGNSYNGLVSFATSAQTGAQSEASVITTTGSNSCIIDNYITSGSASITPDFYESGCTTCLGLQVSINTGANTYYARSGTITVSGNTTTVHATVINVLDAGNASTATTYPVTCILHGH